jgi:hypothetical protein
MATDSRSTSTPDPRPPSEPGRELVSLRRTVVAAALLAVVAVLVLYALVAAWPPMPPPAVSTPTVTSGEQETGPTEDTTETGPTQTSVPATSGTTETTGLRPSTAYQFPPADTPPSTVVVLQQADNPPVSFFGAELEVDREPRLFLVVALTGMLGGLIHAMRSLFWYAGNRNLKASWLPMYGLLPFVGMSLAVVVYVVVRGGLVVVSSQPSADVVNPFGFAALAALAGLFSREAAEWLKGVFERVLTQAEPGRDTSVQPVVTGVDPPGGPAGTPVTIAGTGFVDVSEVTFGRTPADTWDVESDAEISATVPDGAGDGYVRVRTPGGTARSPEKFLVGEQVDQTGEKGTEEEQEPAEAETGATAPAGGGVARRPSRWGRGRRRGS